MSAHGLTRRELLRASVALQALAAGPGVLLRAALGPRRAEDDERVLVVVQLTGGNDGLNTVVPYADDRYHRARPVLAVPRTSVLRLDDETGLHPSLAALRPVWDEGALAVWRGVGPPRPDRSHFRSMEMWHTARVDEVPPHAGWLGAAVASLGSGVLPAALVGDRELPLALAGAPSQVPAIPSLDALRIETASGDIERSLLESACCTPGSRTDATAAVAAAYRAAFDCSERLTGLGGRRAPAGFPAGDPGVGLRLAAQLVGARLGTRVLYVTQGGYDTHAGQTRDHPARLRELAESLAAFHAQLDAQGDGERVVTLVYSEFGRRVRENASAGTDHGAGNPVLLLGRPVRGGVFGEAPDLDADEGDVPVTTDFRRVYASLVESWLGIDASGAVPGDHEPLALLA